MDTHEYTYMELDKVGNKKALWKEIYKTYTQQINVESYLLKTKVASTPKFGNLWIRIG